MSCNFDCYTKADLKERGERLCDPFSYSICSYLAEMFFTHTFTIVGIASTMGTAR
jgi:hypothetical protein